MKTKHYTSIEMSKKLLELGLNPETADMLWEQHFFEIPYVTVKPYTTKGRTIVSHILPCWSLGALMELMPNYQLQTQNKDIGILFSCRKEIKIIEASTPTEAAYKMVCWLLENSYIKTERK